MEKLQHLNISGEDWFSFPNLYRRLVADAFNSVDFQENCWVKVLT